MQSRVLWLFLAGSAFVVGFVAEYMVGHATGTSAKVFSFIGGWLSGSFIAECMVRTASACLTEAQILSKPEFPVLWLLSAGDRDRGRENGPQRRERPLPVSSWYGASGKNPCPSADRIQ